MNLEVIKQFLQIAKSEGVSEINYESKDLKLSVSFTPKGTVVAQPVQVQQIAPQIQASPVAAVNTAAVTKADISSGHFIKSPFVGTFYGSAAPGKPKYVKVGDKVKKGQTLCILEAMKIMNEIESDVDGEVLEIMVENESLVEFDQPLFKIKPL